MTTVMLLETRGLPLTVFQSLGLAGFLSQLSHNPRGITSMYVPLLSPNCGDWDEESKNAQDSGQLGAWRAKEGKGKTTGQVAQCRQQAAPHSSAQRCN